jgi:hypothetical protein
MRELSGVRTVLQGASDAERRATALSMTMRLMKSLDFCEGSDSDDGESEDECVN